MPNISSLSMIRPRSVQSSPLVVPSTNFFQPLAQHVDHADPDVGSEEAFSDLTIRDAMRNMWKDAGVQKAVARGHEFALHDNLH